MIESWKHFNQERAFITSAVQGLAIQGIWSTNDQRKKSKSWLYEIRLLSFFWEFVPLLRHHNSMYDNKCSITHSYFDIKPRIITSDVHMNCLQKTRDFHFYDTVPSHWEHRKTFKFSVKSKFISRVAQALLQRQHLHLGAPRFLIVPGFPDETTGKGSRKERSISG